MNRDTILLVFMALFLVLLFLVVVVSDSVAMAALPLAFQKENGSSVLVPEPGGITMQPVYE